MHTRYFRWRQACLQARLTTAKHNAEPKQLLNTTHSKNASLQNKTKLDTNNSPKTKIHSSLRNSHWVNAFVLARNDSLHITHRHIINCKSQLQERKHLKQLRKTNESMTSTSLCECPHSESEIHQHGESHSPSPPEHKSSTFKLLGCQAAQVHNKKTSTIPFMQLFMLYTQLTPDNVICARNIELEIVDSLDFILDQYIQNKKKQKNNRHCSWTLSWQPELLAFSIKKTKEKHKHACKALK